MTIGKLTKRQYNNALTQLFNLIHLYHDGEVEWEVDEDRSARIAAQIEERILSGKI